MDLVGIKEDLQKRIWKENHNLTRDEKLEAIAQISRRVYIPKGNKSKIETA